MHKVYLVSAAYAEMLQKIEGRQEEFLSVDAKDWVFEDQDGGEERPYQVLNGVALYDIKGPMVAESNLFTEVFGIANYPSISNTLAMMHEDEEVEKVLISMSTPGGNVSGISDVSESWARLNASKPITVHTPGSLSSAGVWLASYSDSIYASEVAEVGSVGAVIVHASHEKALEKEGIEVSVIKSAPLKYVGNQAKDLSEEDKEHLQTKVNESANLFKQKLMINRPGVSTASFTGETFAAPSALQLGLIDGIKTFSEVFENLSMSTNKPSVNLSEGEETMKRKVTSAMAEAAIAEGADPKLLEIVSQEEYDNLQAESVDADEVIVEEDVEVEAEDVDVSPDLSDAETTITALTEEVTLLTAVNEGFAVKVEELEARLEESSSDPLRLIAEDRVYVMRVALGMTKIDMTDFPTASVLAEYQALKSQFDKAYKVGGHVKPTATKEPETKQNVTHISAARNQAVGI